MYMKITDSLALILPGLNRLRPSDVITKVDIIAIIIIIGSSSESKFKLNLFRRLRFQGLVSKVLFTKYVGSSRGDVCIFTFFHSSSSSSLSVVVVVLVVIVVVVAMN
uniref:Uncharacterized protein n=1 Tax=Cacopsylla melanoneura TaxID=428564 RepID=A0A8D8YM99_9HEMI